MVWASDWDEFLIPREVTAAEKESFDLEWLTRERLEDSRVEWIMASTIVQKGMVAGHHMKIWRAAQKRIDVNVAEFAKLLKVEPDREWDRNEAWDRIALTNVLNHRGWVNGKRAECLATFKNLITVGRAVIPPAGDEKRKANVWALRFRNELKRWNSLVEMFEEVDYKATVLPDVITDVDMSDWEKLEKELEGG